ncbi:MAG: M23 family metallopeptidase [Sphingomonadaceae bacterium]|nr:M23 family metallopeptidase [Sphingomonadaceae bacterium]
MAAALATLFAAAACVPQSTSSAPASPPPAVVAAPVPQPPPPPPAPTRAVFELEGDVQQGGVIRGIAPDGTQSLSLNGTPVTLAGDGAFIVAFGRDFSGAATLSATLADGRSVTEQLRVAPTDWQISHVNASPRGGVSSEAFRRRRAPELAQIVAAREIRSETDGWRQDFLWPATGRISSVFGSQRIYRGTPGSYHSGVDIAQPTGTPIVAPADGVVILVADAPFTLEGHLLMIDHGMGLNSAFLHLSRIDVAEGQRVARGQRIGAIGATGRATGPHLHWSMKWRDERIDPQLLAGPM